MRFFFLRTPSTAPTGNENTQVSHEFDNEDDGLESAPHILN